ncbi:MAG: hypothetical protein RSC29_04560 [Oscillospiraceae bacterium]
MQGALSKKDVQNIYGLNLTETEIQQKYPYDNETFNMNECGGDGITVTFNPYHAMQYRNENYPVLSWGKKYKEQRAFAFQRQVQRLKVNF